MVLDDSPTVSDAGWWADANHLRGAVLPGIADEAPLGADRLLTDVLTGASELVTVVAVGPLTNLALLLAAQPEMADRIERVVTMSGAVHVAGNVEDAPRAEWNYYVDPPAARDVSDADQHAFLRPVRVPERELVSGCCRPCPSG